MQQIGPLFGTAQGLLRRAMGHLGGIPDGMILGHPLSDLAGELDHPINLAALIPNRVVGGFQPDGIAVAVVTHEETGFELALGQLFPEMGLLPIEGVITEHAVMVSLDLGKAVAHTPQKIGIGGDHLPRGSELDHGKGAIQRLGDGLLTQQALVMLGHIAGDLDHLGHSPLLLHREVARLQPERLAPLVDARNNAGLDPALL